DRTVTGVQTCALPISVVPASALAQQLKPESDPAKLGFDADRLERLTRAFQGYVDSGQLPGAVVLIARKDKVAYFRAFGFRDRERSEERRVGKEGRCES